VSQAQDNSALISTVLQEWLNERMHNMKLILSRHEITEQNSLLVPSITVSAPKITAANINASIELEDYYIYVDKGVKGIGGGRKTALQDGVYSYKTPFVGRKMVKSMGAWITRKPLKVNSGKYEHNGKMYGYKGASVMDNHRAMSWAIAIEVKKTGIGRTRFFTDSTTEKFEQQLANRLLDRLGENFEIKLLEA
jgi:hypothetical protein